MFTADIFGLQWIKLSQAIMFSLSRALPFYFLLFYLLASEYSFRRYSLVAPSVLKLHFGAADGHNMK